MDFMNKEEAKYVVDPKLGNVGTIQDDEINLYNLWKVIAKRKAIILAIFLIALLGATIYCFTAPPIYRLETYAKLYMPKDILTVKEFPTAKDVALMIGKVDREKKAIIFSKTTDEITAAKIDEIKGTTDKFKITIESHNREYLPAALQELIGYVENTREIKNDYEKIISEIEERIKNVKEADKKNDFQIREIEKRLHSAKLLPVGFNPFEINSKIIDLKMEKYRLEQERQNYKPIRLLEDPYISKDPVKPQKTLILTIACLGSLMIGLFIVFVIENFERTGMKA
jgi:capsular polysaccharide biosynthesis protein